MGQALFFVTNIRKLQM